MRHRVYGIALICTMLAVGANLATTAIVSPQEFSPTGWGVALVAALLGVAVLIAGMLRRVTRSAGLIPLFVGWCLLAGSAAVLVVPPIEALASRWVASASLSIVDLSLVLQASGALGIALGCGLWTSSLVDKSRKSEQRREMLEAELAETRRKLKILGDQLDDATTQDPLTGALNRRTFLERLDETIQRDMRLRKPFAFLLVDVQGFRELNDRLGRLEGDAALQDVATALRDATRGTDFVGRIGGDEFALVLAECTDPQPAITRLLLALESKGRDGSKHAKLVVHVGAVTVPDAAWCLGFGQLFQLAEKELRSLQGTKVSHCAQATLERSTFDVA